MQCSLAQMLLFIYDFSPPNFENVPLTGSHVYDDDDNNNS